MPEVKTAHTFTNGSDFINEMSLNPPDILVTDLAMTGPDGQELLGICLSKFPRSMKIIVFTNNEVQLLKTIIRRGVSGVISKDTLFEEFQLAIIEVSQERQYVGKALREGLINSVFSEEEAVIHLAPREREVLQKVCGGRTIKEIAYDLKLSAHTVQYYHRSVMNKLKVKRTTDLIVYAIQHKLYIPENK